VDRGQRSCRAGQGPIFLSLTRREELPMRTLFVTLLAVLAAASPLAAQSDPGTGAPCQDAAPLLTPADLRYCYALAQAVEAAQPRLGILIAGGNPTLGAVAIRGLRIGALPPSSLTARLSVVGTELPDVRRRETAATQAIRMAAPALDATASMALHPGLRAAGMAGLGAVDLLASATWLPFNLVNVRGLADDTPAFALGAGARVGLLRETFGTPGASVSVMYRHLGRVGYGTVCPAGAGANLIAATGLGYDLAAGLCATPADPGEFSIDLGGWSSRATVGKRLLGIGVTGGIGYDLFRSRIGFGLAASPTLPGLGTQPVYVRGSDLRLRQDRWSAFINGAYTFVLTTLAAEVGWMQGGSPLDGFDESASRFEPRRGSVFGSLGGRLTF
jgi:hypothetical protein